jgi:L-lactate dehydrogenase (cytochrome)
MSTLNLVPASYADYRREAERRLPTQLFHYVDGGAYAEHTLGRNVEDFEKLQLKQRVMHDVSRVDPSDSIFGYEMTIPAALAPIGLGGMMARRGEVQAKRAADAFGIPFTLSTVSICSLEEVAAVSDKPFWFQLYMLKDRGAVTHILDRAKASGVRTLIFTVDLPVLGARYRDVRNGMGGGTTVWGRLRSGTLDYLAHPRWAVDVGLKGKPHTFGNLDDLVTKASTLADFKAWIDGQLDATVTWKDIEWVRAAWDGDLIIKGILSTEDAIAAFDAGADGIVVSNHGGRQLDSVSSTIAILPRVLDAVGGRGTVMIDSGIRTGQDILKAKALGADMTLIGRPWVYANAARGEQGIRNLLSAMKGEMQVSMALTGVNTIQEVDQRILDAQETCPQVI